MKFGIMSVTYKQHDAIFTANRENTYVPEDAELISAVLSPRNDDGSFMEKAPLFTVNAKGLAKAEVGRVFQANVSKHGKFVGNDKKLFRPNSFTEQRRSTAGTDSWEDAQQETTDSKPFPTE